MKKYLKLLFAAIFASLSFALVSCGDDDDDNSALVGTWFYEWTDPDDGEYMYGEMTFSQNGNFNMTTTEMDDDGYTYNYYVNGTYTVSGDLSEGGVVYMTGYDSEGDNVDATISVRIKGNTLYATDEDGDMIPFTRK